MQVNDSRIEKVCTTIKSKREGIERRLEKLREERESLQEQLRDLRKLCIHPSKYCVSITDPAGGASQIECHVCGALW